MRCLAVRTSGVAVTVLFASCISAAGQEYAGREKLQAQSNEFRKEVIRVTDGVYVAVGYSASNVTLIQGDGGSIIVDTSADPVAASAIRTAFGRLFAMRVRAIIYTHSHPITCPRPCSCCGICRVSDPLTILVLTTSTARRKVRDN